MRAHFPPFIQTFRTSSRSLMGRRIPGDALPSVRFTDVSHAGRSLQRRPVEQSWVEEELAERDREVVASFTQERLKAYT